MSLEQKLEELTKAVEANTAAILASQGKTTAAAAAPAADNKGEPEKPKGKPGRKPKDAPAAPATDESDDPFADDSDPFADDSGETERTYTAEDIKALIFKVRKEKSDKDALAIIEAQGVKTLGQIKEDQYPAVVAAAKKLGVTL